MYVSAWDAYAGRAEIFLHVQENNKVEWFSSRLAH